MILLNKDIFSISQARVENDFNGCTVIIPHVCNNLGVFGAGFAAAVRNRYPMVSTNFELLGKQNRLGYVQYVSAHKNEIYKHELVFANMIAQNGVIGKNNPRPLNYESLVKCMIDVRETIVGMNKEKLEIHAPKFGSGLAGGNWNFIQELIDDIWKDFSVYIYYLNNKRK